MEASQVSRELMALSDFWIPRIASDMVSSKEVSEATVTVWSISRRADTLLASSWGQSLPKEEQVRSTHGGTGTSDESCLDVYCYDAMLDPGLATDPANFGINVEIQTRTEEFMTELERYGDVIHATIGTKSLIILNSMDTVTDLFEKRSARYSDRPWPPLLDLYNWPCPKSALPAYYPSHRRAVLAMLQIFLTEPEAFVDHLHLQAGQLIIDVTYGIQISSRTGRLAVLGVAVMDAVSVGIAPVMWVVNPDSFLQSFRSWLGGRNLAQKTSISSGTALPSLTARLLQEIDEQKPDPEQETLIMDCAVAAIAAESAGGADTTVSVAHIFVLVIVLHPAVQCSAQVELDRVVEVMRWHPIAPQGVPHRLIDDDEYRGYWIPKGSLIIGNMWAILHDPAIYANPHEFTPERHLDDGKNVPEMDPLRVPFGFGRRVCPGNGFAMDSLWLLVAQVLAVYTFDPVPGAPARVVFTSGGITHPMGFKCTIGVMSEKARALVEEGIAADGAAAFGTM
ncbi:cytochrome P450 [Auriscalpium vulgare]|uniref:Cytochrome P450 n=1 Tax=Auriscalpium vulgare TaxID=40419 RepID=A0ACB8RAV9_9AGAM|nr:cytochrome P450 [Auriscalpium vulgare]